MNIGPDKPQTMQDVVEADRRRKRRRVESSFQSLLDLCDGKWTSENPDDIADIACSTINRRNDEIRRLLDAQQATEVKEVMLKPDL